MDKRSKKIIFCVHCLLNQNARAKGVAKCAGAVPEFLEYCIANDFGIVPIDCPQLRFEPLERAPEAKEHYDNPESRNVSLRIIDNVIVQIKNYVNNGYEVCGIYGVEGSPTCGAVKTHVTDGSGKVESVFESGIFFEELKKRMLEEKLDIKIFDWDIQAKSALSQRDEEFILTNLHGTLKTGGIVFKHDNDEIYILMVHRGRGINDWTFPKGHLKPGEELIARAMREILEETGIEVKNPQPITPHFYTKSQNNERVYQNMFVFEYEKGELRPENNTDAPEWVKFDKVEDRLTYPETKDYWNEISKLIIKENHDKRSN